MAVSPATQTDRGRELCATHRETATVIPGWREGSLTGDNVAQLYELLEGDLSDRSTVQRIRDLLAVRLGTTAQILGLAEAGDTLADRLVAAGLVETYSRRIGKRAK